MPAWKSEKSVSCSRGGDAVAAGGIHALTGAATRIGIPMHRIRNRYLLPAFRRRDALARRDKYFGGNPPADGLSLHSEHHARRLG